MYPILIDCQRPTWKGMPDSCSMSDFVLHFAHAHDILGQESLLKHEGQVLASIVISDSDRKH